MYRVIKTMCYPKRWKVASEADNDNSWVNYFATENEAYAEANRRNEMKKKLQFGEVYGTGPGRVSGVFTDESAAAMSVLEFTEMIAGVEGSLPMYLYVDGEPCPLTDDLLDTSMDNRVDINVPDYTFKGPFIGGFVLDNRFDERVKPLYFDTINEVETYIRNEAVRKDIWKLVAQMSNRDVAHILGYNLAAQTADHWVGRAIFELHEIAEATGDIPGKAVELIQGLAEYFANKSVTLLQETFARIESREP